MIMYIYVNIMSGIQGYGFSQLIQVWHSAVILTQQNLHKRTCHLAVYAD